MNVSVRFASSLSGAASVLSGQREAFMALHGKKKVLKYKSRGNNGGKSEFYVFIKEENTKKQKQSRKLMLKLRFLG